MLRTHTCNDLTISNIDENVSLCGWIHRRRDHGGLVFIDLRDRYGLTQVVFDPDISGEALDRASELRSEFVLKINGTVRKRPEGMSNDKINSGEIEVVVNDFEILNRSKVLPFEIDSDKDVNEELRLKYRYLDLRREKMQRNIIGRHKLIKLIRDYMDSLEFIEVETPIMIKGTPEGSREYVVPSRLHEGTFYVLPQSPQQLKQMLMVSGFDKYFQIAKCFRDEDQRGDRQPEFTQLDVEMSFVEEDDVMDIMEELMIQLSEKMVPEKKIMSKPFPRMTWQDAMDDYGSDKPDVRFEMKMKDVTEIVKDCDFQVFSSAAQSGGVIKALKVDGGAKFTRKEIDELTEVAKIYGAKGLAYITLSAEEGIKSPILKFLGEEVSNKIIEHVEAQTGDIIFFTADEYVTACEALGHVRLACGDKFELRDNSIMAYLWVYEFPMFEYDKDTNGYASMHHPFTSPLDSDVELMKTDPGNAKAKAYDLVMNGIELGGGSIRIHDQERQSYIFEVLGISKESAQARFGHILDAFTYGAPPHGGIALGIDRIAMLFMDEPNIREVMAFPKDQKARDLMTGAPSPLPEDQIAELHIKTVVEEE